MLLTDLLSPERVAVPLSARDKPGIIRELATLLVDRVGGDLEDVVTAVREREAVLSTGIGHGVAIPHGRSPTVPELAIVCGSTPEPVPFDAIDGEPVRIFFMLVGPERCAGQHVKALGRIARLVRGDALRERLLAARTPDEFYGALAGAEAAPSA
ncbi:MAG TPA: PTS sugar transporter subunit IIA [Gemmatimonadales bacterium]|nr:PTS sugar transporter subunit IIA [Gemmatimonadales bacterium]